MTGAPAQEIRFRFCRANGERSREPCRALASPSDQATSTEGCWDQCRACLGDGALLTTESQPGGVFELETQQPVPWEAAEPAGPGHGRRKML